MGTQSTTNPRKLPGCLAVFALLAAAHAQTTVVLLLSPTALAFDASGSVYIAETGRHIVDRFDPSTGKFSVVAGTGIQGFSGDGGPATGAELDSPQGLALDPAGNLYIADTHNQRIRKLTTATGLIATIAGTGIPGYAGDGGQATNARLSLPSSMALDIAGNLFIADTGNQRIRRVAASNGTISTVAGNGTEGNAGDGAAATSASLDSPVGLAIDSTGNLYIADTHNHRVRMVDASSGIITTLASGLGLPKGISVDASGNIFIADTQGSHILKLSGGLATAIAGTGTEGFAGDGGPATSALLDSPRSAGISPAGLVTLADTHNQRIRQVDAAGVIRTLTAIGNSLLLSGPAAVQYGTGALTATLAGATGTVTFYEVSTGTPTSLGTASLSNGAASFNTAALAAGNHRLLAAYGGDAAHAAAESAAITLTISPAPVVASAGTVTTTYGQTIPALTGTLTGLLPRDAAEVLAVFATEATRLSPAGSYPISATLTGAAAGNYTVSTTGSVAITQAASITTLASSVQTAAAGTAITLSAKATTTTQGTPTGKISFLDSGVTLASIAADTTGTAAIPMTLGAGTHSLTATYAGDTNFLPSTSSPLSEIITPVTALIPDFTLNPTNGGAQNATGGSAATFAFAIAVTNGSLSGPILLAASGLPTGATASFNPAVIPPGGAVNSFTLTIQTVKPAAAIAPIQAAAVLFGLWLLLTRRRRHRFSPALFAITLLAGCGDRVASLGTGSTPTPTTYPITVTGTSTASTGAVLQHTAVVTLTVQ